MAPCRHKTLSSAWKFLISTGGPGTCRSSCGHGIVFKLQESLQILEILVSIKAADPMEENKSCLVPPVALLGVGDRACASQRCPPRDHQHLRQEEARVARRVGSGAGSGVLGFANIIGWNIALLPVSFGQPPFRISRNVFKVQDLESLIG